MNGSYLNVFIRKENLILDLIDKIVDLEEKKITLSRYIETQKKKLLLFLTEAKEKI